MERLEISTIGFSELNAEHRIDAEYFSKSNLEMMKLLMSKKHQLIGDFSDVTDGIHKSIDYDENSPVNLISATSPRENYFDLSRNARISEREHNNNPRTALKDRDVILSTVGTIGNCAVVSTEMLPANSDRHVGIIRVNKDYSPYVVSTYLLSKYGRMQTKRETTGNVQPNLFLYKIREIVVPEFAKNIQDEVESNIIDALAKRKLAENKYQDAEKILLNNLGFDTWHPAHKRIAYSCRMFKDIMASERIDAEYYQHKYDEITEYIKKCNYMVLSDACKIYDKNYNPDKNVEYRYLELSNIGVLGEIIGCTTLYGSDLPTRARRIVNSGNVIISSIEGSLQNCALITEEYDKALCSNGFFVLESSYINSETLLVLLKSWPVQSLLKRACSGTILTAYGIEELKNIPLPIIDKAEQLKIAQLIKESLALRKKSDLLISKSKRIIEKAIEGD
ncbi:MAG: hypothetical protein NC300_02345 [Bacteroidales bacterium]|nr:hypothetical protein [Clostridium sp.]MCM1202964.1 hypothetical protein [Bacteroidales bacterium]